MRLVVSGVLVIWLRLAVVAEARESKTEKLLPGPVRRALGGLLDALALYPGAEARGPVGRAGFAARAVLVLAHEAGDVLLAVLLGAGGAGGEGAGRGGGRGRRARPRPG